MRPPVLPAPSGHPRRPALRRLARWLAPLRRPVLAFGMAVLASLVLAEPVRADNCGDPSDCFGVQRSALAATVGVLALTVLSLLLDFTPVVGTIKGLIEGITGRDVVTGERLEAWERAIGWVPFVGKAGKLGRIGGALDDVGDVSRAADDLGGLRRTAAGTSPPRRPGGGPSTETPSQPREPASVGGRTTEASPSRGEAGASGDAPSGGRGGGRGDGSDGGGTSPEPRARSGRGGGDDRPSTETPDPRREPVDEPGRAGGNATESPRSQAEAGDSGGGLARGGGGERDGRGGPGRGEPGSAGDGASGGHGDGPSQGSGGGRDGGGSSDGLGGGAAEPPPEELLMKLYDRRISPDYLSKIETAEHARHLDRLMDRDLDHRYLNSVQMDAQQARRVNEALDRWADVKHPITGNSTGKSQGVVHIDEYAAGMKGEEKAGRLEMLDKYAERYAGREEPFDGNDPAVIADVTDTLDGLKKTPGIPSRPGGENWDDPTKKIHFVPKDSTFHELDGDRGLIIIEEHDGYVTFFEGDFSYYKRAY